VNRTRQGRGKHESKLDARVLVRRQRITATEVFMRPSEAFTQHELMAARSVA
jgi:hypothetical protein